MEGRELIRNILVAILVIVMTCTGFYIVDKCIRPEVVEPVEDTVIYIRLELTEWQLFQMALIEVESDYDSQAISSADARGILQETEQYIAEVNRLTGTEWTIDDAHNDTTALDCFVVMQRAYNPEQDIERAIYLHNPNAGAWYKRRVLAKMEEIRRREAVRTMLLEY